MRFVVTIGWLCCYRILDFCTMNIYKGLWCQNLNFLVRSVIICCNFVTFIHIKTTLVVNVNGVFDFVKTFLVILLSSSTLSVFFQFKTRHSFTLVSNPNNLFGFQPDFLIKLFFLDIFSMFLLQICLKI